MHKDELVRLSKFLSYTLRHDPGRIGLTLDTAGWAVVSELLQGARGAGVALDRDTLERVVRENDKQRFAFSSDGQRIRANQGHSIPVDLGLEPRQPPEVLYHGTAQRFVHDILKTGLLPRQRQHVHLSPDIETARKVGSRHGRPVVLAVRAGQLFRREQRFFLSQNGVWLTDYMPPDQIEVLQA